MLKKSIGSFLMMVFILCIFSNSVQAGRWRLPVGLAYVNGLEEIVDLYEDNLEAEGYIVDTSVVFPVGITFQPYFEFDNGFGLGLGVGPIMYIDGDVADFVNVPINADVRYLFLNKGSTAPYLRAGVRTNVASGEYVESSSPGFIGGFGIEFLRDKRVNMGIEILYDSSEIEFTYLPENSTKEIKPNEIVFSVYVIF